MCPTFSSEPGARTQGHLVTECADVPRDPFWWSRGLSSSAAGHRPPDPVWAGFTGRGGAEHASPYGQDNLGLHVGDDAERVRANRRAVAERAAVASSHLLFCEQVHGTQVLVAEGPWGAVVPTADAVVTKTPGLALAVMVADCVPVLLMDQHAGVVGVVHAGRAGMADGVVEAALGAMAGLGASAVHAVVGPSICARCYEVPEVLRRGVAVCAPVSASVSRTGTPSLDLAAGVLEQLSRCEEIELLSGCTAEREDLFSYRRDGRTGRFAGVVGIRAPEQP